MDGSNEWLYKYYLKLAFVFSDNPPSDTFFPTYYKSDIIEI